MNSIIEKFRNYYALVFIISIVISSTNYAQETKSLSNEELLNMSLEDLMNIPVITASDKLEDLLDAPANIYVLYGEQLRKRGYTSLQDLMADLPGVTWLNRYSAFNAQVIRGQYNSKRLTLMFDGMIYNPRNGFGVQWADRFPIEGVEKIEFIIGPYASLYGRNTFSGVLNVITKKGEKLKGGEVNFLYGKDNQLQSSVVAGNKIGEWDFYMSLFKNYSNKGVDLAEEYPEYYSKKNREKEIFEGNPVIIAEGVSSDMILPWDNNEVYFKVSHKSGLDFQLQYNHSDMPKIGAGFTPLYYVSSEDCKLTDKMLNGSLSYKYKLNEDLMLSSHFTYQNFDWLAKNIYVTGNHRWYTQKAETFMFNQKGRWQAADWNELFFNISVERVYEKDLITSTPNKPAWTKDNKHEVDYLNISVQDQIHLTKKLNLVVGLMYEKSDLYKDVFIPRFSGIYSFDNRNILKLIYSAGFLTPDPEVRVTQYDRNGAINLYGRTNMDPEYINSFDLNFTRLWNKNTSTILSIFYNQTNDFIQQVEDLSMPGIRTWKNIGTTSSYGFDFTINSKITKSLQSCFSYSFVDGSIHDLLIDNLLSEIDRLPTQAIHHFKFSICYTFWDDKLNLYLNDLFIGNRYTWEDEKINGYQFAVPDYKLAGYNIVDINLNTANKFSDKWRFSVGIRNLFNEDGFDPTYSDYSVSSYSPIRKRWWNIQIGYKF
ncbi:MAG: TonB-dependent receptor [Melioribacteraceae bacterium]|nr:TonB-dependent receptor [Melioribacteraceae bacterium]